MIQRLRLPSILSLRFYFDDSDTAEAVCFSLFDWFSCFRAKKKMQCKIEMAAPTGCFPQQNSTLGGLRRKMISMR